MDERTLRGKSRIKLGMTLGLGGMIALPIAGGTGSKAVAIAVMVVGIAGALWAISGLALTYRHEITQARARRAPFLAGLAAVDAERGGGALNMVGGASKYNTMLAESLVATGEAGSMAEAFVMLGVAGNAAVAELHGGIAAPAPQVAEEYPDYPGEEDADYEDDESYPRSAAAPPAQPVTPPPSGDLWGA